MFIALLAPPPLFGFFLQDPSSLVQVIIHSRIENQYREDTVDSPFSIAEWA